MTYVVAILIVLYVAGLAIGYFMDGDSKRIKCNIQKDGDKVYHIKGDKLYNVTKIDKSKGEFYARTETEALEKGFRRSKVR
jgi:hypothetical protein